MTTTWSHTQIVYLAFDGSVEVQGQNRRRRHSGGGQDVSMIRVLLGVPGPCELTLKSCHIVRVNSTYHRD